jgi:purine-binding chemotaxis protein CheW
LVFSLDQRRFAVRLTEVERVEPAAAIIPLPKAPPAILGLADWHGRMLPVYDARGRFGLPPRALALSDRFILLQALNRLVAFCVDNVEGVVPCPAEALIGEGKDLPSFAYVAGAAKLADDTILLHDIDLFLSAAEQADLAGALSEAGLS